MQGGSFSKIPLDQKKNNRNPPFRTQKKESRTMKVNTKKAVWGQNLERAPNQKSCLPTPQGQKKKNQKNVVRPK